MKTDTNLSDIFGIENIPAEEVIAPNTLMVPEDLSPEADFEFARKNMRELLQKGNKAVDKILLVADATDHPRAYEVASNMIKQLGDMNKDLLALQKTRKDLSPEAVTQPTVNVDKAVFVGSTADLIKQIKQLG
jgi:GTPase SAR1 family protein